MKFFVSAAALASLVPAILALQIDTPTNPVQCQPLLLTFGQGQPPYFVSVIPGGQPAAPAFKAFPETSASQLTWVVDIARGTACTLAVRDQTGATAFSDIITILDSPNSDCVNPEVNVGGSGSGSGGAPQTPPATGSAGSTPAGAPATSAPAPGTTGPAGSSSVRSTGSTAPTGTGANAATNSNAASRSSVGTAGFVGVLGMMGIALF